MINEQWLCSSLKLCKLVTTSQSAYSDDTAQIAINSDLAPQPTYNPSSIQHTLETYSRLLEATLEQNREPIQHFAGMTAQTIIDSALRFIAPSKSVKVRQDEVEMLAEELTLQVCSKALEEMERHHCSDDSSSKNTYDGVMEGTHKNTAAQCSDKNTSEMETACKMDISSIAYVTSLKSMTSFGSIEYPDAPPSTPLLPEMIRSRASFTRKLKGGLAKEFLPSPPPPTPKDHMQPLQENQMGDASADFVVRLMRSLSLECCRNGGLEELDDGQLQNDRLTEYAARLSADILSFITTNEVKVKDGGYLKCILDIADQLATEIVSTSLAEIIGEPNTDTFSTKRSSVPLSAADGVNVLSSELIFNAVAHAFAKLRQCEVKHETQPHVSDQAVEPQPWEEEQYSNTLCRYSINSHTISPDHVNVTSSIQRFAKDFVEDALQQSVCDASSRTETGSQNKLKIKVIKVSTMETRHIQELQCALLWAVASQRGTSALQFDLPDKSLQQQLCRLSRSARLNGWTVGALMAFLHEICDMQRESSRGSYESSESLLEHLQHLIDNVRLN